MGKAPNKKLILLSDISGLKNTKWISAYVEILSSEFEVITYCSLTLAGISPDQTKEEIHQQFVNGGFDKASEKLVKLQSGPATLLGFSLGGVIAWKAGILGLQIDNFYAVSSTRLREETRKPIGELKLIFGEDDIHKPDDAWYHEMEIIPKVLANQSHELYKKDEFIKQFASQVIWANGIIY
ncbi:MAG: hypothetical protein ACI9GM_000626 [Salibacteraceae bacterium]|jgi:hypothetical protein